VLGHPGHVGPGGRAAEPSTGGIGNRLDLIGLAGIGHRGGEPLGFAGLGRQAGQPVLVVVGGHDPCAPPARSRAVVRPMPVAAPNTTIPWLNSGFKIRLPEVR